jgi:hypothetical protein
MNVEKGVFESTISSLLDVTSKIKDELNTHKNLQALGTREELHSQERPNGKVYLPPASHTLTNVEKRAMQVPVQNQSPHWILDKHKESSL